MFAHPTIREAVGEVFEEEVSVNTISPVSPGKNRSYRITLRDDTELFLKVGTRFPDAFPAEPKTMEVVRRDTELPVPRVHGTGKEALGYPFAVYEFVDGAGADWVGELSPATAERLCREAGRNLDALHRTSFSSCGRVSVEGNGLAVVEPLPFRDMVRRSLERQIAELRETPFASHCRSLEELGEQLIGRIDFERIRPALVHGDYRLDNLCIDPTGDRVTAAVLDWELPTAADPLWDAVMAQALLTDGHRIDSETRRTCRTAFWQGYGGTPNDDPRWRCYELLARIRLARHLTMEMRGESDAAMAVRVREHRDTFDDLLDGEFHLPRSRNGTD